MNKLDRQARSRIITALVEGVDYAMLVNLYGQEPQTEARYSPPKIMAVTASVVQGKPNPQHISTSFVERQNLTMRMGMRRFTRLTNGFSKKVENLEHPLALHFMFYNFCRVHKDAWHDPRDGCWRNRSSLVSRRDRRFASKLTDYPVVGQFESQGQSSG